MEYLAPLGIAAIFAAILVYVLRSHAQERETYIRAINFSIKEGSEEREQFRQQISEMATRIQHPEFPRPDLHAVPEPVEPPEPDPAFEKVGRIFPDNDNGDVPDEAD